MPETPTITPALSAEEWVARMVTEPEFLSVFHVVREEADAYYEKAAHVGATFRQRIPAVMALANHALRDDDPRKITWADVDALAAILEHPARVAEFFDQERKMFYDEWKRAQYAESERDAAAQAVVDKLRAILPPREAPDA